MMGKVKGIARNETKKPAKNFISRFYKFVHSWLSTPQTASE